VNEKYTILKQNSRQSSLFEEFGCSSKGVTICGRVAFEKQKYTQLEEELAKTKKEKEQMRLSFESLLKVLNRSLRQDLVIETFKQQMADISEVKSVYCLRKDNILSFSIFINEENWEIEDKIYDVYGSILNDFSEIDVKVKVLRLWGRKENEVLAVGGSKILGKSS
jgi:hypothetical protein